MQRASQRERILHLLQAHEGEWISAYNLSLISLRYGARIHQLRKLGHTIDLQQIWVDGQCQSAYRFVRVPTVAPEPLDALLASWYERIKVLSPQHMEETCET